MEDRVGGRTLSPAERVARLERVRVLAQDDVKSGAAAAALGLTNGGFQSWAHREIDFTFWPPSLEAVDRALKIARAGKSPQTVVPSRSENGRDGGDPRVSGREIERRREAVRRQRLERERAHLDTERAKYRLPRRGRPLSEMPI